MTQAEVEEKLAAYVGKTWTVDKSLSWSASFTGEQLVAMYRATPDVHLPGWCPDGMMRALGVEQRSDRRWDRAVQILKRDGLLAYRPAGPGGTTMAGWFKTPVTP